MQLELMNYNDPEEHINTEIKYLPEDNKSNRWQKYVVDAAKQNVNEKIPKK